MLTPTMVCVVSTDDPEVVLKSGGSRDTCVCVLVRLYVLLLTHFYWSWAWEDVGQFTFSWTIRGVHMFSLCLCGFLLVLRLPPRVQRPLSGARSIGHFQIVYRCECGCWSFYVSPKKWQFVQVDSAFAHLVVGIGTSAPVTLLRDKR